MAVCLTILLSACGAPTPEVIFVLAGQSNAVGNRLGSAVTAVPPVSDQASDVLIWYETGSAHAPTQSHDWETLGSLLQRAAYWAGPELGIAEYLAKLSERRIGIVKVAFEGTELAQTDRMDWHPDSKGELYARLLQNVRKALIDDSRPDRKCLAGIFWIQGESDAKSSGPGFTLPQPYAADSYKTNLEHLISRLRTDLQVAELPVFVAALNTPEQDAIGRRFDFADTIKAAQSTVATALPRVYLVATEGLAMASDRLHYSRPGQRMLGVRLGRAVEEAGTGWLQSDCVD
jgi:hypothetical protein